MRRFFTITIEDCEGVTKELLEASFSERVASLVAQESEDKSRSWNRAERFNDKKNSLCSL